MADYTPERGPALDVDLSHGIIQREYRGVATTVGRAIVRRLSLHGSREPDCFDHEVLLPASAPDDLRNLARLVEIYERQLLPMQRDLLGIAHTTAGNIALALSARRKKVTIKMIWGSTLISNEVGPMIFETFLPAALAEGRYAAAPPAEIVGQGLAAIPTALERQRRGVSATKLVVTL